MRGDGFCPAVHLSAVGWNIYVNYRGARVVGLARRWFWLVGFWSREVGVRPLSFLQETNT
ncbi:hypothetical protein [Helicobacter ganmani]|uniref:hypothetical protein n=1 Tax=Helicobacter ganmani TaxID=60246 RepID=UPI003A86AC78